MEHELINTLPPSTSMSATAQNTQTMSLRPCSPVDTSLPTSEDEVKPHTVIEEPVVVIEGELAKNMSSTLEQILDILRGSTIVEERGKDVDSKFWATYKKVANEHDDDFLARANDDMGIILTFAGLFSAVNSAFIIGMQPSPGETTNTLLLHLIQITADPNAAHDISNLSSSTGYSSSTLWMQALGYASLATSVMAAFGAVLGKQWLNSYKAGRGRGSLEERCIQRQMKLDGLERFHLPTVLQVFLVLLQISLLLFGLSLSANMWIQQTTISSVIICTTAFGMLFYAVTIFVSVWRADSPFQTPGSEIVGALCKRCLQVRSTLTHNIFSKSSAIRWILETSTNPEVVEAAAAMIPLTQWSRELDASAAYARLRDNFSACRDSEELFVKCGKAMAHLCSQSVKIHRVLLLKSLNIWHYWGGKSRFLRDAFMDSRLACHQLNNTKEEDARRKHKADVRTALRTMVVHGLFDRLSLPDNEKLIWQGDLRWRHSNGLVPGCEEFDWLIDYLVDEADDEPDEATQGDALLVLNAMRGLGSSAKQQSYIKALTLCMGPTRPPRVRHAALKAISDARGEIVSITDSHDNAKLLDDLSCALFTAVCPNHDQTIHDTGPDAFFNADRDHCYFRLVFALAKHDEWRQRLTRDGHLERCISLFDEVLECETWTLACYLIGIFMRIDPSDRVLPFSPTKEKWRMIVRKSWRHTRYLMLRDFVETLPALVTVTRQNFTGSNDGVSSEELTDLAEDVHRYLAKLQDRQAILVNSEADSLFDVALSSVQGLYDDLSHMIETQKTS